MREPRLTDPVVFNDDGVEKAGMIVAVLRTGTSVLCNLVVWDARGNPRPHFNVQQGADPLQWHWPPV